MFRHAADLCIQAHLDISHKMSHKNNTSLAINDSHIDKINTININRFEDFDTLCEKFPAIQSNKESESGSDYKLGL